MKYIYKEIRLIFQELKECEISLTLNEGKLLFSDPKKQLSQSLRDRIAKKRGEIIALIAEKKNLRNLDLSLIPKVSFRAYYPASSQQRRLYALQQLEGSGRGIAYNMPGAYELAEGVDIAQIEAAVERLIDRHEALRTSFEILEGKLVQRIGDRVEFEIEHEEVSELEIDSKAKGFVRAFDLSKAPLLRMKVLTEEGGRQVLLVDLHHIISDGTSMGTMISSNS